MTRRIRNLLKEKYDIEEEDFLSAELEIVPAGRARECGLDNSMILAYGQDDRVCAFTSLFAILEAEEVTRTACCLLVDKEEIGSTGASGMTSRFFENAVAEYQQLKDAPTAEAEQESGFGSDYQKLLFSDGTYAGGVSQILVNGNVWEKVSSKYSLFRRNAYYMDSSDASVVFDGSGNGILTNGDIITIKNPSYQDLLLRVKGSGSDFAVEPYDPNSGNDKEGQGGTDVRPDQRNRDLEELGQAARAVQIGALVQAGGHRGHGSHIHHHVIAHSLPDHSNDDGRNDQLFAFPEDRVSHIPEQPDDAVQHAILRLIDGREDTKGDSDQQR